MQRVGDNYVARRKRLTYKNDPIVIVPNPNIRCSQASFPVRCFAVAIIDSQSNAPLRIICTACRAVFGLPAWFSSQGFKWPFSVCIDTMLTFGRYWVRRPWWIHTKNTYCLWRNHLPTNTQIAYSRLFPRKLCCRWGHRLGASSHV